VGTTSRFGYRYPALTDAPNGPQAVQFLAEDVEEYTSRAFPCTSTTRPTGVGDGFIIRETDTGKWLGWTGSAWTELADTGGGSGGGGGGGGSIGFPNAVEGQWRASNNQSLSSGSDTVLAFGTTEITSSIVTRSTLGSGHRFTLTEAGVYAVTATVRFAAGTAGSRFIELRNSAQSDGYVSAGDQGGPAAATRHFSITKRFAAAQELVVIGAQSSGSTLSTEYVGSAPVVYRVRLTISKIGN
jgi:hypothetical protein